MVSAVFPSIPRALSAFCEWYSCLLFLLPLPKRHGPRLTVCLVSLMLPVQMLLQYLAAQGTGFVCFLAGMAVNVAAMYLQFRLCTRMTGNGALLWTMYAFSMAECLASLDWQIVGGGFCETHLLSPVAGLVTAGLCAAAWAFTHLMMRSIQTSVDRYPWSVTLGVTGIAVIQFLSSNLIPDALPWQDNLWLAVSFGMERTLLDCIGIVVGFLFMKYLEEQEQRLQRSAIAQVMDLQYRQHLDFLETSRYMISPP